MLDTTPKLAQCQKCQAYVFQAQVNGYTVLVDPAALQGPELTLQALGAGKALYSRHGQHLRPSKNPLTGEHLAAHGCTVAGTVRADKVEVAQEGPQTPVCDVWRASGWSAPRTCPRRWLTGAQSATGNGAGLLAEPPTSCNTCEPPPFEKGPTWTAPAPNAGPTLATDTPRPSFAPKRASGRAGIAPTAKNVDPQLEHEIISANTALRYIKPTRCDICRKLITIESTGVCTIEYDGRIIYGVHQQC